MARTIREATFKLRRWMPLGPLYAAGNGFCRVWILSSSLMIELFFDQKRVLNGASQIYKTLYI